MNFLAHLALSPPDPDHLLGAVLGDFVRGSDLRTWPPAVERGIRLHRAIDAATDASPEFAAGRALLHPTRRRFAGVILDIFFDHFLARDWASWHPGEPLPAWSGQVLRTLLNHPLLEGDARRAVEAMHQQRWLTSYAQISGIALAMQRMSQRRPFLHTLHGAEEDLIRHEAEFAQLFARWYPALHRQSAAWLEQHPLPQSIRS